MVYPATSVRGQQSLFSIRSMPKRSWAKLDSERSLEEGVNEKLAAHEQQNLRP